MSNAATNKSIQLNCTSEYSERHHEVYPFAVIWACMTTNLDKFDKCTYQSCAVKEAEQTTWIWLAETLYYKIAFQFTLLGVSTKTLQR